MNPDERWMRQALKLARRGLNHVHPNPMVGAVLVKQQRLIGSGYHRRFGGPHAEVDALSRAGARARGATLYVNLEPCAHWGKTPPCVDAILAAGVRRVVAALRDPNPAVAGKGFRALRAAGVEVVTDVLKSEAQELNRAFLSWISRRRPYVTLKAAASIDGKIATAGGESQWITGPEARAAGHRLRAEADAVAVGIGTVLADDPHLTAHGAGRNPIRVIFDSRLRTPRNARCLDASAPTWILAGPSARAPRAWADRSQVRIVPLKRLAGGGIDLRMALDRLAADGVAHLLVEGGATLNGAFLDAGLVDEVVWFLSPRVLGGARALGAIGGRGVRHLQDAPALGSMHVTRIGDDLCIRGALR